MVVKSSHAHDLCPTLTDQGVNCESLPSLAPALPPRFRPLPSILCTDATNTRKRARPLAPSLLDGMRPHFRALTSL